jgi:uracil-DNA glycosylase
MLLSKIHPQWRDIVDTALKTVSPDYLSELENSEWLPGKEKIFNAFSLPKDEMQYILFGESPYPRAASAIGYAFWDGAVSTIWDEKKGLSKAVNRATSLRNLIKMLLFANGSLATDFSQPAIAKLDKSDWINTLDELFQNLLNNGFLLLNASLVLSNKPVQKDVSAWRPFMASILEQLAEDKKDVTVILLGSKAQPLAKLCSPPLKSFSAEHPYQISFITNPNVVDFFKPFHLLKKS